MTTAILARPTYRTDRDGVPIRRVVVPNLADRRERVTVGEGWARLSLVAAVGLCAGMLIYDLKPHVGWWLGIVDALAFVGLLALSLPVAQAVAPTIADGLHGAVALSRSLAWWLGLTGLGREQWLPPLPFWPSEVTYAVIPWHGRIARDAAITRRTRLARHVDWILVYDHQHVVAVARVTRQRWDNPGYLARILGPRVGLSARAYRTYTDGHRHVAAIETDLAYTLTRPVTLAEVGITGPLGSHRYLGGKA